ncbi:MAG: FAD-dependent oxidoreductase [Candidatus Stahlbacteria bacterium]|nr:FAD-dependent oxidoreductase [Candidatus Stahlbacteria bacterium]
MTDVINSIFERGETDIQFPQITYTIKEIGTSGCKFACPIDTDVKAYLGLIVQGKFEKALEVIKKDNPLPGICGRVCIHPCESECSRNKFDQPLSICSLKRFLSDNEFKMGRKKQTPIKITKKERVAIVGSGPAGLAAANDLIRLGYGVTIFESLPVLGGMLAVGIPSFRLLKDIVQFEIESIKELGVEIKTNTRVGKDITLDELKKEYQAILLAIGAQKGLKSGIIGEDKLEGIIDFVSFLKKVNLGEPVKSGKVVSTTGSVVVIGGTICGLDSARVAKRLGFNNVVVIYSMSENEMPVPLSQINEAEKEGVKIHYLTLPIKILRGESLGKNGKVVGVECMRTELGEPDAVGRRLPVPIENSNFIIKADTVITAVNREPDLSSFAGIETSILNTFVVDPNTLSTSLASLFAAGDCVTGPKTVIEAIAAGHKVARSIDRYLRGEELKKEEPIRIKREWEIVIEPTEKKPRNLMPILSLDKRIGSTSNSFAEVEVGFDEAIAVEEAKRCLLCGPCSECLECIKECDKKLVSLMYKDNSILLRVPSGKLFPMSSMEAEVLGEKVTIEPIFCEVDEKLCRGCGKCEHICEYGACKVNELQVAKVDIFVCKGCGICAAVCPSGAMKQLHFTNDRINSLMRQCLLGR